MTSCSYWKSPGKRKRITTRFCSLLRLTLRKAKPESSSYSVESIIFDNAKKMKISIIFDNEKNNNTKQFSVELNDYS